MLPSLNNLFGEPAGARAHDPPGDELEVTIVNSNHEQRALCVLMLDMSGSMAPVLPSVEACVNRMGLELQDDPVTLARIELAVVRIGGQVEVLRDFGSVENYKPLVFKAHGGTPLAEALLITGEMIQRQLEHHGRHDVDCHKVMVVVLTDGNATDPPATQSKASELVRELEQQGAAGFFPVATQSANLEALSRLFVREPKRIDSVRLSELFGWVLKSLQQVSRRDPGMSGSLPAPNWATF